MGKVEELEKENADKDARIAELEAALKKKVPTKDEKANRGKARTIDFDVEVEATEKDAYHLEGERFKVGVENAVALEKKGLVKIVEPMVEVGEGKNKKRVPRRWADKIAEQAAAAAKFLIFILFAFAGLTTANAQGGANNAGRELRFYNPLHEVIATPASDYIDTVTNTGTSYISTIVKSRGNATTTTIQVNCTKISGTVAGTITIQGSLDNVNFKALPTEETQTALATATALDVASQTFVWRLKGSPFTYYRISWTGSGTMAASFNGYLMSH